MKRYYVQEVEDDSGAGVIGFLVLFIIALIPLIIALAPIWFFITKALLKNESKSTKKYKFLRAINKVSKVIFTFQVVMAILGIIVMGFLLIGHYLGFFNFIDFSFLGF